MHWGPCHFLLLINAWLKSTCSDLRPLRLRKLKRFCEPPPPRYCHKVIRALPLAINWPLCCSRISWFCGPKPVHGKFLLPINGVNCAQVLILSPLIWGFFLNACIYKSNMKLIDLIKCCLLPDYEKNLVITNNETEIWPVFKVKYAV